MHASKPKAPAAGEAGAAPGGAAAPAAAGEIAEPLANRLRKNLMPLGSGRAARGSAATGSTTRTCRSTRSRSISTVWRTPAALAPLWAVVQEYEAPKTVDPEKARARLAGAVAAVGATLELPRERVVLKIRRQRRGREQHEKLGDERAFHRVPRPALLPGELHRLPRHRPVPRHPAGARAAARARRGEGLPEPLLLHGDRHRRRGGRRGALDRLVDLSQTYLGWGRRTLGSTASAGGRTNWSAPTAASGCAGSGGASG